VADIAREATVGIGSALLALASMDVAATAGMVLMARAGFAPLRRFQSRASGPS
jgi:hypothetical protein